MDNIILKGLEFLGYHGVLPKEKLTPQLFKIDINLYKKLNFAAQTDNLDNTINYAEIYDEVKNIVENNSYNLIERLAESIAQNILIKYPISAIKVKVYKPNAPVEGKFDYFAVEIFREKNK